MIPTISMNDISAAIHDRSRKGTCNAADNRMKNYEEAREFAENKEARNVKK